MSRELARAEESLFWYWINERHRIYLKRSEGVSKPWTDDPIFRDYKFTNAFRQLDRGTAWLTDNFIQPHWDDDPGLIIANVAWYRMFNYWGTGVLLGWQPYSWYEPVVESHVKWQLHSVSQAGGQIFTNAHIIWSEQGMSKIDAIVSYAKAIWKDRDGLAALCRGQSLEIIFDALNEYRGIGGFQAYEIVTDLRHTRLLENATDINNWANMGPGAQRGLRRLGMPANNAREGLQSMRELLLLSQFSNNGGSRHHSPEARLQEHVPALELRDIEHSLCEFDKYCRVKFGEGEPRMKYNGRA